MTQTRDNVNETRRIHKNNLKATKRAFGYTLFCDIVPMRQSMSQNVYCATLFCDNHGTIVSLYAHKSQQSATKAKKHYTIEIPPKVA